LQIQFCCAFIHQTQLLYTDCGYPRWSVCFTLPNAVFFYFLFNDFYQKSYKKKQEAAKAKALSADNNNDGCAKDLNKAIELQQEKQKAL